MESHRKVLAIIVAFDLPGQIFRRRAAKMLAASMIRTGFPGDLLFLRNWRSSLFLTPYVNLREIFADATAETGDSLHREANIWRLLLPELLDLLQYSQLLFLDINCLAVQPWRADLLPEKAVRAYRQMHIAANETASLVSPDCLLSLRKRLEPIVWAQRSGGFSEPLCMAAELEGFDIRPLDGIFVGLDGVNVSQAFAFETSFVHLPLGSVEDRLLIQTGLYLARFFYSPRFSVTDVLDM